MSSVTLTTHITAAAPSMIVNTATAGTTAEQLSTANITASDPGAVVPPTKVLGYTGLSTPIGLFTALSALALLIGLALMLIARRRRSKGEATDSAASN
jgi:hypothetical protein